MAGLLFLTLCPLETHAQQKSWEELNQAGMKAYQQSRERRDWEYAEAEKLLARALKAAEAFGTQDPRYATSLYNLALVYLSKQPRRYVEAEQMLKRSLSVRETALGPEHPNTVLSLSTLSEFYKDRERYAEAELHYKRYLKIIETTRGPEDLEVGRVLAVLADMYKAQGRYTEADPLYKRSLDILETALGPEHPDFASIAVHHAYVLRQIGREEEAAKAETRPKKRCDTPEFIETVNKGAFQKRFVHVKGKNAIVFVLLDPIWSVPDFDDVPHRQEADMASIRENLENLKKIGLDEVVAWTLQSPPGMGGQQPPGLGVLMFFKEGCALEKYGGLIRGPKLVAMNDAFALISERGIDDPNVRESIRILLKHSPFRFEPDDKKIDVMITKIRPYFTKKMRR